MRSSGGDVFMTVFVEDEAKGDGITLVFDWFIRNISFDISISIDFAFIACKYFGSIFFLLASIKTISVVFKQLTFS
jgi:hypothetical protein